MNRIWQPLESQSQLGWTQGDDELYFCPSGVAYHLWIQELKINGEDMQKSLRMSPEQVTQKYMITRSKITFISIINISINIMNSTVVIFL